MIRMFQYLFMPLASSMTSRDQILTVFKQIRANIVDISDTFTALALAMAGFFIGIKLIKLSYETLSDEQGSGFGGIQLKQILVPIVLLMCIAGYKYLIGGFDYGVTVLTTHICNNTAVKDQAQQNLAEITVELDSLDNKYMVEAKRIFQSAQTMKDMGTGVLDTARGLTDFELGTKKKTGNLETLDWFDVDDDDDSFRKEFKRLIKQYLRAYGKSNKASKGRNGVIAGAAEILFNSVYLIVQALAELYLCLFVLLGPFTIAFSVFDQWSNAWRGFAAKYIEVSFWIVVATVIDWLVSVATGTVSKMALDSYYTAMASLLEVQDTGAYFELSKALTARTLICIAGIIALFSVPDITSALLNIGAGGPAMGGANGSNAAKTAATAPAKTVTAAAKTAIKIFTKK